MQDPYQMMSKSFYGGKQTRAVTSQMSQYNEQDTVENRHTLSQSMLEVSNFVSDQKKHLSSSRNPILGTNSMTQLDPINSRKTAYGFNIYDSSL